jgi:hypothetical protein
MKKSNKKQLKSILINKDVYEKFKATAKLNGFKVKELVEILMKIYQDNPV